MLLKLNVYDRDKKSRGTVRLKLDWAQNKWSVKDDPGNVWPGVGFTQNGSFEYKSWGVIWVWDQPHVHNTVIVWDAPASEAAAKSKSGKARIVEAKEDSFKEGSIDWTIESAGPPALSQLRQKALTQMDMILPALYGSQKWKDNPFHSLKPGPIPNYTNCVEFPAYLSWILQGKPKIDPKKPVEVKRLKLKGGYPPKTTKGWKDAGAGELPIPGDVFILCKTGKRDGTTAHVAVVYSTDWNNSGGRTWRTGDWGQGGDSWCGDFVERTYDAANETLTGAPGDNRPPRAILGWVDLDELFK